MENKEEVLVEELVTHEVLSKPFNKPRGRESGSISSSTRLGTISEDSVSEEFFGHSLYTSDHGNNESFQSRTVEEESSSSSMQQTTPPTILRKRLKSAEEINIHLEKELQELSQYTSYELQMLKAEKGYNEMNEQITMLHSNIEDTLKTVKKQAELISILEEKLEDSQTNYDLLLEEKNNFKRECSKAEKKYIEDGIKWEAAQAKCKNREEELKKSLEEKQAELKTLQEKVEVSQSNYEVLLEENNNLKRECSKAEKKIIEDGIKWEAAQAKWKNREEELKKSLEEAWNSLKVKETRLTSLKNKIRSFNERSGLLVDSSSLLCMSVSCESPENKPISFDKTVVDNYGFDNTTDENSKFVPEESIIDVDGTQTNVTFTNCYLEKSVFTSDFNHTAEDAVAAAGEDPLNISVVNEGSDKSSDFGTPMTSHLYLNTSDNENTTSTNRMMVTMKSDNISSCRSRLFEDSGESLIELATKIRDIMIDIISNKEISKQNLEGKKSNFDDFLKNLIQEQVLLENEILSKELENAKTKADKFEEIETTLSKFKSEMNDLCSSFHSKTNTLLDIINPLFENNYEEISTTNEENNTSTILLRFENAICKMRYLSDILLNQTESENVEFFKLIESINENGAFSTSMNSRFKETVKSLTSDENDILKEEQIDKNSDLIKRFNKMKVLYNTSEKNNNVLNEENLNMQKLLEEHKLDEHNIIQLAVSLNNSFYYSNNSIVQSPSTMKDTLKILQQLSDDITLLHNLVKHNVESNESLKTFVLALYEKNLTLQKEQTQHTSELAKLRLWIESLNCISQQVKDLKTNYNYLSDYSSRFKTDIIKELDYFSTEIIRINEKFENQYTNKLIELGNKVLDVENFEKERSDLKLRLSGKMEEFRSLSENFMKMTELNSKLEEEVQLSKEKNVYLEEELLKLTSEVNNLKTEMTKLESNNLELQHEKRNCKEYSEKYNSLHQSYSTVQSKYKNLLMETENLKEEYAEKIGNFRNEIIETIKLGGGGNIEFEIPDGKIESFPFLLQNLQNVLSDTISQKKFFSHSYNEMLTVNEDLNKELSDLKEQKLKLEIEYASVDSKLKNLLKCKEENDNSLNQIVGYNGKLFEIKKLLQMDNAAAEEEEIGDIGYNINALEKAANETVSKNNKLTESYNDLRMLYDNLVVSNEKIKSELDGLKLDMENVQQTYNEFNKNISCNVKDIINLCKDETNIEENFEQNTTYDLLTSVQVLHKFVNSVIGEKLKLHVQCKNQQRLLCKISSIKTYINNMNEQFGLKNELVNDDKNDDDNDVNKLNEQIANLYSYVNDLILKKEELYEEYKSVQKSFDQITLQTALLNEEITPLKMKNEELVNLSTCFNSLQTNFDALEKKCNEQEKTLQAFKEISNQILDISKMCGFEEDKETMGDFSKLNAHLNNIYSFIQEIILQQSELKNKYNKLESSYNELDNSFGKLTKEMRELSSKSEESNSSLMSQNQCMETELQSWRNKYFEINEILSNCTNIVNEYLVESYKILIIEEVEDNFSVVKSTLDHVLPHLKILNGHIQQVVLEKTELREKLSATVQNYDKLQNEFNRVEQEYNYYRTNSSDSYNSLREQFKKLQSELEELSTNKATELHQNASSTNSDIKNYIIDIFRLFSLEEKNVISKLQNNEIEYLKKLKDYIFDELDSLRSLSVMLIHCEQKCNPDSESLWSDIKNSVHFLVERLNEKKESICCDSDLQKKLNKLESELHHSESFRRHLAIELHGMEPQKSVYDLMRIPPKEFYEEFMMSIMNKEEILISNIQNDYEKKITCYKEKLNQLEIEEKRQRNWISQLESENEKLSDDYKMLKMKGGRPRKEMVNKLCQTEMEIAGQINDQNKGGETQKDEHHKNVLAKLKSENDKELEEKNNEIKNFEKLISEKSEIIKEITETQRGSDKKILELLAVVNEKDDFINKLQQSMKTLMADMTGLEISLTAERKLKCELKTENEKKEQNIHYLQQLIEENQKIVTQNKQEIEILQITEELAEARRDLHSYKEDIEKVSSSKLAIINNLQSEIDSLKVEMNNVIESSLCSLKKEVNENQITIQGLNERISDLIEDNADLKKKLHDETMEKEELRKERDEIKFKQEQVEVSKSVVVHCDDICPYKKSLDELKCELEELNKKQQEQLDYYVLMKQNLEEDIQCKSVMISELDNKLKTLTNVQKQTFMAKTELYEKLERITQECKEKERRFDEKLNIQRDMYLKEKKNLELEVKNKVQIIEEQKNCVKNLELIKDNLEEKLKSQFDSLSNEIRHKNELIDDFKEKVRMFETHNKEKLSLKREIANKESIINDLKNKLIQSRDEIEKPYIELNTFKNKLLEIFECGKTDTAESVLNRIQQNINEIKELKKQIEELEIKNTHLDEECDLLHSHIQYLEGQLGLTYKWKVEEVEKVTSELKEERQKLEANIILTNHLKNELQQSKEKIIVNESEIKVLECKMVDLQNNNKCLKVQCDVLKEKNNRLSKLTEDLKKEMLHISEDMRNKNWKISELENRLQEERINHQHKNQLLTDYKAKLTAMKDENFKYNEKLKILEVDDNKVVKQALVESKENAANPIGTPTRSLGEIRDVQVQQLEEKIEKLVKKTKIYKKLCEHRQLKITELEKALKEPMGRVPDSLTTFDPVVAYGNVT